MASPQNKDAIIIVLQAIDSNLGRYTTDEEQFQFLEEVANEYQIPWEGHGNQSAEVHDGESLHRCLKRLLQSRLETYKEMSGEDKVRTIFELGSSMIEPKRLAQYGYKRQNNGSQITSDGKRKRVETEAGKEFKNSLKTNQRRSEQSASSQPAHKKQKQSTGDVGPNATKPHDRITTTSIPYEFAKSSPPQATTRTSSGRTRANQGANVDSDNDNDGSSQYQDAISYEHTGANKVTSEVFPTPEGSNRGSAAATDKDPPATTANGTESGDGLVPEILDGEPDIRTEFRNLDKIISNTIGKLLKPGQYPAVVGVKKPSKELEKLYEYTLDTENWQATVGTLTNEVRLDAREFATRLIWSYLHSNILDQSHKEAPLLEILNPKSDSYESIHQTCLSIAEAEDSEPTGAVLIVRKILRQAARRQLDQKAFIHSVVRPQVWRWSSDLRHLMEEHLAPSCNRNELTDTDQAGLMIDFKNICEASFMLDAHVRIWTDHHSWRMDLNTDDGRGLLVRPGLLWRPAADPETGVRKQCTIAPLVSRDAGLSAH